MNQTQQMISFRPINAEDNALLYRIYASTRQEELAVTGWSDEQKEMFLQQQFTAQSIFYEQHFPDASFKIILDHQQAIGRLYVDRRADEIRIIDIALIPNYRGAGIGSEILNDILNEAAEIKKAVKIHVEKNNPALNLYYRLGFKQIDDQGVYLLMEWLPDHENQSTMFA